MGFSNTPRIDFNAYTGGKSLTTAFTSSASAQNTASGLFGVGYGDRGYGQTTPPVPSVSIGKLMLASDWVGLRDVIERIALHQGQDSSYLPPASEFKTLGAAVKENAKGMSIYDEVFSYDQPISFDSIIGGKYNIGYLLSILDQNRFTTNFGASMSLTTNVLNVVRPTAWGAGPTGITMMATATFPSEEAARYFFNSGGEIRFSLTHPTGFAQDRDWNAALINLGSVSFKANGTTRSGNVGNPSSNGYYQLTTSDQVVLSGVIGSGAYSTNTITVSARAASIAGVNGAKGSQIIFTINLLDTHATPYSDLCSGGTSISFSHLKATSILTGITSPTITQTQAWA